MDEFYEWLKECYHIGELTDEEIEDALARPEKAFELFMECFRYDAVGTAGSAQRELIRLKDRLKARTHAPKT